MRLLVLALAIGMQMHAAQPQFEVASVKRAGNSAPAFGFTPGGRFTATDVTLKILIMMAYHVHFFQLAGEPDWLGTERFDINAKAQGDPDQNEGWRMVQSLLEDRFRLRVHRETRELPIYALIAAKNGPKLRESIYGECHSNDSTRPCGPLYYGDRISGPVSMKQLASMLSQVPEFGRRVIDKTGLTGTFDIDLKWTPAAGGAADDTLGPSIFTALQDQLGLRLESEKGPVEMLVIDHIEKPGEN